MSPSLPNIQFLLSCSLAAALPQLTTPEKIPACAFPPALSALQGTGCTALSDVTCVCAYPGLQERVENDVIAACGDEITVKGVHDYISNYCAGVSSSATVGAASTSAHSRTTAAEGLTTEVSTTEASVVSTDAMITETPFVGILLPTITSTSATCSVSSNGTNATWSAAATPSANITAAPTSGETRTQGMSVVALAIAVGGLTWIFAEL